MNLAQIKYKYKYKPWRGKDRWAVHLSKAVNRLGGKRGKFWLPDQLDLVDLGFFHSISRHLYLLVFLVFL